MHGGLTLAASAGTSDHLAFLRMPNHRDPCQGIFIGDIDPVPRVRAVGLRSDASFAITIPRNGDNNARRI